MAPRSRQIDPVDTRPVVLVLGDFAHEGLSAKMENLGFQVINRRLRSGIKNRIRIVELMRSLNDRGELAAVFSYLPTPTLLLLADQEFDEARPLLLAEMVRTRSLLFIYEDNLQGSVEPVPWEYEEPDEHHYALMDIPWPPLSNPYRKPTREEWLRDNATLVERTQRMISDLAGTRVELVPFRKRSDVTIRMFEALDDLDSGVLLRIYVPHGRYQSDQFEEFLGLFSRYLREVENREISIDVQRTASGTTYIIKGHGDAENLADLHEATQRFDDFMSAAHDDPKRAELLFAGEGITPSEAQYLVAKYARAYRRLTMEIRHEFEQRRLVLGQEFEADLLDSQSGQLLPAPDIAKPSSLISVIGNTGAVTINLPSSEITIGNRSRSYIERMIAGNIVYTTEERELLSQIGQLTDDVEVLRLRSELDRLKDATTPADEKRTAAQKLKTFIYKSARSTGKKATEIGTHVLVAYLEGLVSGKAAH